MEVLKLTLKDNQSQAAKMVSSYSQSTMSLLCFSIFSLVVSLWTFALQALLTISGLALPRWNQVLLRLKFFSMLQFACMPAQSLQSYLTLCDTLGYAACKAPLSMGFSRQEYWSGLPGPPPGDLPDPGIELESPSPALQADSSPLSPMLQFIV